MSKEVFRGVATALITPFEPSGAVNYPMLDELINFQIRSKTDAIVLCGTTGECATLSEEEKICIFNRAVKYSDGKIPIIAGIGSNDTKKTVILAQKAEQCGVDALLAVTPYYNKTTQRGVVQHFTAVAQSVNLPLILYNVPSRTGFDISVEAIAKLAEIPGIVGIKEACGSMEKITRLRLLCPNEFSIYAGNDTDTLPILSLGGRGVISVASNLIPNVVHSLYDAFCSGNLEKAQRLQLQMTPLQQLLFESVNPINVKALMELIGFPCGACRLPLEQLEEKTKAKLLQRGNDLLKQFKSYSM